jgi:hypothetical protein
MLRHPRTLTFRSVAVLVALNFSALLLTAPGQAQEQQGNDCAQGKTDGKSDAKGSALWFFAGLGCGLFGVGAAYLVEPSPPPEALMGKCPSTLSVTPLLTRSTRDSRMRKKRALGG